MSDSTATETFVPRPGDVMVTGAGAVVAIIGAKFNIEQQLELLYIPLYASEDYRRKRVGPEWWLSAEYFRSAMVFVYRNGILVYSRKGEGACSN